MPLVAVVAVAVVLDLDRAAASVRRDGDHVVAVTQELHAVAGGTVQYTAAVFAEVRRRHGIRRSTGRVGSSYDNALAESFFQGLKRELLHGRHWTPKAQTRLELFRWLSYYNRRRRHSALGYLTPAGFEQQLITSRPLSLVAWNPVSTPGGQPQGYPARTSQPPNVRHHPATRNSPADRLFRRA